MNSSLVVDRSCMKFVACQQLAAICADSAWQLAPALLAWLSRSHSKLASTQAVEDAVHHQKGKVDKQNSHRAREQRAFGQLLEKGVLGSRHRYDEIDPTPMQQRRGEKLCPSAFRPPVKQCSIPTASNNHRAHRDREDVLGQPRH